MEFKSLIISPILRADQHFTRKQITILKEQIENKFLQYGTASCTYYSQCSESSFHGYEGNYAIVDFQRHKEAKKALTAARNGKIYANKMLITAKPIELSDSPIQNLPTECLLKIFKQLSKYEQLKLQKVCTRWRKVAPILWKNVTKIDLIGEDAKLTDDNHIINSSVYLKEIRCYGDHGLKLVQKHCPNVENITIEFRKYPKLINSHNRAYIRFEPTLLSQFDSLTRLMLKIRNDQYTYFDFLQQLPVTMVEIHLLNDITLKNSKLPGRQGLKIPHAFHNYARKLINLSRFSNLQALTLKAYKFDNNSLMGFENLQKLRTIRLDDCFLSQTNIQELKCFTDLEHLSLRNVEMYYMDARVLLDRNKTLNYLALPMLLDFETNQHESLWALALRLPTLKTLCWTNRKYTVWHGRSMSIENMELNNLPISIAKIVLVFEYFPNLKIMKKTLLNNADSAMFIKSLRYVTLARCNSIFKLISGQFPTSMDSSFTDYSQDNFQHVLQPTPEDAKLLRCDYWNGWYVDDESLKSQNSYTQNQVTINQLTDVELAKIFEYLPIDDKVRCSKVCKRWQRVVKDNPKELKNFDVRKLSNHSSKFKCLKYGKYFEDVYCYKSCGFLPFSKCCPNLKNLAVDFGVKSCACKSPYKNSYSILNFITLTNKFKYLTKLMMKDISVLRHDVLQYFPSHLQELHVFNRSRRDVWAFGPHRFLTLSRFNHLRALTLVQSILFPINENLQNTVEIIGLNRMSHLVYLRISGDIVTSNREEFPSLPLQYLSLTQTNFTFENISSLIKYGTIQYLDITDTCPEITERQLCTMLSLLQQLRVFRIAKTYPHRQHLSQMEVDIIPVLPHLEILDCKYNHDLLNKLILSVIRNSPNLKMVNTTISHQVYLKQIIAIAEDTRMKMNTNTMLNLFVGRKGIHKARRLNIKVVSIRLAGTPSVEYYKLFERLSWQGWTIQNGAVNIDKICKNLIKSLKF